MLRALLLVVVTLFLCTSVVCAQPIEDQYSHSRLAVGDWTVENSPGQRRVHPAGAVTGMAFAPGSRELAYCTESGEGDSALWVASIPDIREWLPFWEQYVESRVLWRPPPGVSLSGPIWWSPEGGKLAVCATGDSGSDVIGIDRLTGETMTLIHGVAVVDLAWRMHGERVAYAVEADSKRGVWLQTYPPTEPRCLGMGGFDLRWTLDGKLTWRCRDENWKLMSWNPASDSLKEIETSVVPLSARDWSPDGKLCAELLNGDTKNPGLALYEGNNSTPEVIPLPGAGPARMLGWSPDSRLVLLLCQGNYLLAISARPPGPGVIAMAKARSERVGDWASARASLMIWPALDPHAGPPAWTSGCDAIAFVCPDEERVLALNPRLRAHRFMEGAIPYGEIVVQGLQHSFIKAPKETEVERIRVTTNMKNVALCIQMYLADNNDIFPSVEEPEKIIDTLGQYVKNETIFMRPGSDDEISFWYVVPAGLRLVEVRDPCVMPVAFVDYDPTFVVVAYGDGHVEDFDRTPEIEDALEAWWEGFQQIKSEDATAQPPPFEPPSE